MSASKTCSIFMQIKADKDDALKDDAFRKVSSRLHFFRNFSSNMQMRNSYCFLPQLLIPIY